MRKHFTKAVSLIVLICLLAGCSTVADTPSDSPKPSDTVSPSADIPEIWEMTVDELCQEFQQIFDSCGGILVPTEKQLAVELEKLEEFATTAKGVPENYRELYKEWRTEYVAPMIAEQDAAVQTEYEQIINDAQLYEVHGSGLVYADYVDVDGDSKVELLTLGLNGSNVTATVYANNDGHAGKACEETFMTYGGDNFSICKANGDLYLCQNVFSGSMGETYDYFKIDNGSISFIEQAVIYHYYEETPENDTAILQKYTDGKSLFIVSNSNVNIQDRGLLPTVEEYWVAANPIYGAVLNGDFSAFAGNYTDESGWGGNMSINKDGVLTAIGGYYDVTQQKPISVTVTESGAIRCVIRTDWDGYVMYSVEYFILYPAGVSDNGDPNNPDYQSDPTKVRLEYWWPSQGVSVVLYSKIS